VKATKLSSNVQSMLPWTLRCPRFGEDVAPWCSVFHQSTEKWIDRHVDRREIAKTALRRARSEVVVGPAQRQVPERQHAQDRRG
jgi:hypothetical protein